MINSYSRLVQLVAVAPVGLCLLFVAYLPLIYIVDIGCLSISATLIRNIDRFVLFQ